MIVDLGNMTDGNFFGEIVLSFQNGKIVLVRKTETFKLDENQERRKSIDFSAVVVLR